MGLIERVAAAHRGRRPAAAKSWSQPDFWDIDRLRWPFLGASSLSEGREQIENDFEGYVEGVYKRNGPVFALMAVRMLVFSEARFQFRRRRQGRPGDLFGDTALAALEQPWPGGTTGDLLSRMIQDADLAGNAFLTFYAGRIRRMRPDRVTILMGSRDEPDLDIRAGYVPLDVEVIGYLYSPRTLGGDDDVLLLPEQVAHFAPIPDPDAHYRGMSWLTPVIREISSDNAATLHKKKFFENGATPQVIVSMDAKVTPEQLAGFKARMDATHQGVENAYRTLYLGGGADVTVVGRDLAQLDFKAVQGAGETRLAAAAGVPSTIVGFSEGLAGSSLNAGNYGSAKRRFVDGTIRPLWRNAAGSLAGLVDVPADAELWYDARDIPFLREDNRDVAEIQQTKASTIRQLIDAGFKAETVVAAVEAEDFTVLQHSGLFSVQLQPPGTGQAPPIDPSGQSDPAKEQ